MLLTTNVDFQVAAADMLADYHALIYLDAGPDEQRPALLCAIWAKPGGQAGFGRDQRAVCAGVELTSERLVAHEQRVDNPLAARGGQEGLAEAEQPARWHVEHHMDAAIIAIAHIAHNAAARTHQ